MVIAKFVALGTAFDRKDNALAVPVATAEAKVVSVAVTVTAVRSFVRSFVRLRNASWAES
jgi:hypothetical protein